MAREKLYTNDPVVIVFKTSNRSNAQTKMKVFKSKTIDDIINPKTKLPGIPDTAVFLSVGLGEIFIKDFKLKYKL